jgi:hypothetical protein
MPQAYMVALDVKTAADLKKKLSATVAGSAASPGAWSRSPQDRGTHRGRRAIHRLRHRGPAAGPDRRPDRRGRTHPEDAYLAKKQKPTPDLLVQLTELMPNPYSAYGASLDWIGRDRALLRDAAAAMIEANRTMYTDKAKVASIEGDRRRAGAVEYATMRSEPMSSTADWTVQPPDDRLLRENGDIGGTNAVSKAHSPAPGRRSMLLAAVSIGNCKD